MNESEEKKLMWITILGQTGIESGLEYLMQTPEKYADQHVKNQLKEYLEQIKYIANGIMEKISKGDKKMVVNAYLDLIIHPEKVKKVINESGEKDKKGE